MLIKQIHHVAYRCNDAAETVAFYRDNLGMDFLAALSEDRVPSTGEADPYMHLFLDAGNGNILAFFEIPNSPPMGRDPNTPAWVQHIAFLVENEEVLTKAKADLEAKGIEVIGPIDHSILKSIYFFDPNGHRLELAAATGTPEMMGELHSVADAMLADWSRTKSTQRHAAWIHEKQFAGN